MLAAGKHKQNDNICDHVQQQRRQLSDCAFQWAELQELVLGEESDLHDNRNFLDERNRNDRRQVEPSSH